MATRPKAKATEKLEETEVKESVKELKTEGKKDAAVSKKETTAETKDKTEKKITVRIGKKVLCRVEGTFLPNRKYEVPESLARLFIENRQAEETD